MVWILYRHLCRVALPGGEQVKLETDIHKIKLLATQQEKINWRFRSFLKWVDLSVEEIESVVQDIYRNVSGAIDCRQRNCCKEVTPV